MKYLVKPKEYDVYVLECATVANVNTDISASAAEQNPNARENTDLGNIL